MTDDTIFSGIRFSHQCFSKTKKDVPLDGHFVTFLRLARGWSPTWFGLNHVFLKTSPELNLSNWTSFAVRIVNKQKMRMVFVQWFRLFNFALIIKICVIFFVIWNAIIWIYSFFNVHLTQDSCCVSWNLLKKNKQTVVNKVYLSLFIIN